MITFNVLGPLEIVRPDGTNVPIAPKVRLVLALFLVNAGAVVSIDNIVDELWEDHPPRSATTTAQTYVYQLRKLLNRECCGREPLATLAPGYILRIGDQDLLDVSTFRQLVLRARSQLDKSHPQQAAELLRQALDVWRGPPLANVACGRLLKAQVAQLKEEQSLTLELRIEVDFNLGRHRRLIGELRSLVLIHPLNEWFHARLIEALSLTGRRREALEAYRNLHSCLYHELGILPSPEVQQLQRDILATGLPQNPAQSDLPRVQATLR